MSAGNRSRVGLWVGVGLLAVFAGVTVYQVFAVRFQRYRSSQSMLAELAEAELLEETPAAGWPQWRGPNRDGVSSMPGMLRAWPDKGPSRAWQDAGGDGYSSFAIDGGRVYTMLTGKDNLEAIVCWNLETGKEQWRHEYPVAKTFDYGGPRATPTVVGDRLFTLGAAGKLVCLNLATGTPVWEVELQERVGGVPPRWGYAGSPLVEGGLVYVAAGGSKGRCLAAFREETGDLAWATQDDPAGYSSPLAVTIAGVRQVVFFTGRRLLAVTPGEGRLLWEFPWPTPFDVNAATPVVVPARSGGNEIAYVFISSGYGKGCALVRVGRAGEGFVAQAVYESNELCCHFASPVRRGGFVYALDETRDLTCLDLRTGAVRWRFEAAEEPRSPVRNLGFKKGSVVRVDDVLVVLGEEGKLALVEATPESYRELAATRPFRDRCWASPAVADGRVVLRDRRQVLCLDIGKR